MADDATRKRTVSGTPSISEPGRILRVACVQLSGGDDRDANVERAIAGMRRAAELGAELIVLPEKFSYVGDPAFVREHAEPLDGPSVTAIQSTCRELGVWSVAGSIVEQVAGQSLARNTSVLIDATGAVVATYSKLHMFDVDVAGVSYRESDYEQGGNEIVTATACGVELGMSICYDLRFPELYRTLALRGATVVVVPAAFTKETGKDHWDVLLRARAIENQCFVVAANLIGDHGGGRVSYGRSVIVDPWGVVIARAPDRESVIVADLHLDDIGRVRAAIPSLAGRRPDVYG